MPATTPPPSLLRTGAMVTTPTQSSVHSRISSADYPISDNRRSVSEPEEENLDNLDNVLRNVRIFIVTTQAIFLNLQDPDPTTEAYKKSLEQAMLIVPQIIDSCDLTFKSCSLAADAQLRCLEIIENSRSMDPNATKLFAAFKENPTVKYATDFLRMSLCEIHDRSEADVRQAITDCLTDEKSEKNNFIVQLKTHSKDRSAASIIRDGASVNYVDKTKNNIGLLTNERSQSKGSSEMTDLRLLAAQSLLEHLTLHSVSVSLDEAGQLIALPLETILADPRVELKKAISSWLNTPSNNKFSNREQELSGVPRNRDLESALDVFLKESEQNEDPFIRWTGSIILCRRAVQLITIQTNQINSKLKGKRANVPGLMEIISDFSSLVQGLKEFIRYSLREKDLRQQIFPSKEPVDEKSTDNLYEQPLLKADPQVTESKDGVQYANEVDKQFNYFIEELSQAAAPVNALNLQPIPVAAIQTTQSKLTLTPSQEVIQCALQACLFRHVQAEKFDDDDFQIMETIIAGGMRTLNEDELRTFEEFNLQIDFFQSQITVLDSFLGLFRADQKRKKQIERERILAAEVESAQENSESKNESMSSEAEPFSGQNETYEELTLDKLIALINGMQLRILNLANKENNEVIENKFLDDLLISFKNSLVHKDHFLDPLKKDWIEPGKLQAATSRLMPIFEDLLRKPTLEEMEKALHQHFRDADNACGDVMDDMWKAREDLDKKKNQVKQEMYEKIPEFSRRRSSVVDGKYISTTATVREEKEIPEEESRASTPNNEVSTSTQLTIEISQSSKPKRHMRNRSRISIFSQDGLEELSSQKVSANVQDRYGNTPLHYAVKLKNEKAIKLLLDYNADPTIKNKAGKTPFDLDSAKLLQEWRDMAGNTLLHQFVLRGQAEAIIYALRCNHPLSIKNNRGDTVFDLYDDKKANLMNQFLHQIPLSEFQSEYLDLYNLILGERDHVHSAEMPETKGSFVSLNDEDDCADLLAVAKLAHDENAKLEKLKISFDDAANRFNHVIEHIYRQLFQKNGKEKAALLNQLRAVQEAILAIAKGKDPQKIKDELVQSPIISKTSDIQKKIRQIDWRFQAAEQRLLIPVRDVKPLSEDSLDSEMHLAIKRHDNAWLKTLVSDESNMWMLSSQNVQKHTPVMLATRNLIESKHKVERYTRAIKAVFQAFTDVEAYLVGKMTKYDSESSDYTKLVDKLKEITLAKDAIIHDRDNVTQLLENLKNNAVITEKRNKWDFWHKQTTTVKCIDKTLAILVSPVERLEAIVTKLKTEKNTLNSVSKGYKKISGAIAALLDAKSFIVNNKENPLEVLLKIKEDERLTKGFGFFSLSGSPVLKDLDKIIADLSPPVAFNALAPPSAHVMITQRSVH